MATIEYMPARLAPKETEELRQAVACLEGTSFAQRLTDAVRSEEHTSELQSLV